MIRRLARPLEQVALKAGDAVLDLTPAIYALVERAVDKLRQPQPTRPTPPHARPSAAHPSLVPAAAETEPRVPRQRKPSGTQRKPAAERTVTAAPAPQAASPEVPVGDQRREGRPGLHLSSDATHLYFSWHIDEDALAAARQRAATTATLQLRLETLSLDATATLVQASETHSVSAEGQHRVARSEAGRRLSAALGLAHEATFVSITHLSIDVENTQSGD